MSSGLLVVTYGYGALSFLTYYAKGCFSSRSPPYCSGWLSAAMVSHFNIQLWLLAVVVLSVLIKVVILGAFPDSPSLFLTVLMLLVSRPHFKCSFFGEYIFIYCRLRIKESCTGRKFDIQLNRLLLLIVTS